MIPRWVLGELFRFVVLIIIGAIVGFLGVLYWVSRGPVPAVVPLIIGAGATVVGVLWFRHITAGPENGPTTWRYRR
jgi:hypothetical protein